MRVFGMVSKLTGRAGRWIGVAAGTLFVYAVLGFVVVPAVIRSQLPPRLGRLLGREVTLERVRANPFTFSVTIDGFAVKDRDGGRFVGWQRLYVNLQLSSLFTRTVSFRAIELTSPYGQVVLEADGRLNFSDIVKRLSKPATSDRPEPAGNRRQVAIGHLAVRDAQLVLADRRLTQPFTTTVGPLTIDLTGFRTARDSDSPYAFAGRTESGESFSWSGFFSLDPLRSEGRFGIANLLLRKYRPYYQDRVRFELREGAANLLASYVFAWTGTEHVCRLSDAALEIHDLALGEPGHDRPPVRVPLIAARGISADLLESSFDVRSLTLEGGNVEVARLADGAIDLMRLLSPVPSPASGPAPGADVGSAMRPGPPLRLLLRELAVDRFRVSFDDRATARPVHADVEDLSLRAENFDLDPSHTTALTLAGRINGGGTLRVDGTVAVFKPAFDLAVTADNLAVRPFDPYLEPGLDVRVNRGSLSLSGRARGTFEQEGRPVLEFAGDARLDDFEAMDGSRQEPFLRYRSLRLTGLELSTMPKVLRLRSAELIEPENRLVVADDGTSNVARALKITPAAEDRPQTPVADIVPPTPQGPGETPFAVSIVKVAIQGGKLAFIDRSLEPNAALLITDIDGTYTGLSSEPATRSAVTVRGRAGGLAPVLIEGQAMPLRHDKDTDVSVVIDGAELSDFGPYAGKYLGYTIRKGKLGVKAHLTIKDRRLNVDDTVRMDQFFLGEKTGSPDATKLPVKLALALLRDRKGVIELEVPIEGSLDDPEFRWGKVVWHAIVNVLTKLVTSPFALLGKLFGGGDQDLSFATFEPGSAEPDEPARSKAEVLAKALFERPDLSLEVEGTADPGADVAALKKAGLERLLLQLKRASQPAGQPGADAETAALSPEERETWLKAAFAQAFPTPPPEKGKETSQPPPPPPAEMEQRLLATIAVGAGELRQLADARTKAMIALVLQGGSVDASRVFEVAGGERAAKEGGARVYFTVR